MKQLITILALLGVCCGASLAAEKPNIIFILSDDLAQGDLGCYGQKIIQTPRIDQMARDGVRDWVFDGTAAYCSTKEGDQIMPPCDGGECAVDGGGGGLE